MGSAPGVPHDHRSTIRILVADGHDDTRSFYRDSLRRAGCDVVEAADGRDALVKALSQRPTLVITETHLPIFDGYALCEVLRRDSATSTVPIMVVTTETRHDALERARAVGANAVLVKPVPPEALLNEVQRLLARSELPPDKSATRQPGGTTDHATGLMSRSPTERERTTRGKAHLRTETTTPPKPPPNLLCPSCARPLRYERSYTGGVSRRHWEQWDAYRCPASCGAFEYRQRTRKLRQTA